jgi:hypothetical protein
MSDLESRMRELTGGNTIETTAMLASLGAGSTGTIAPASGHAPGQQPDLRVMPSLG